MHIYGYYAAEQEMKLKLQSIVDDKFTREFMVCTVCSVIVLYFVRIFARKYALIRTHTYIVTGDRRRRKKKLRIDHRGVTAAELTTAQQYGEAR